MKRKRDKSGIVLLGFVFIGCIYSLAGIIRWSVSIQSLQKQLLRRSILLFP